MTKFQEDYRTKQNQKVHQYRWKGDTITDTTELKSYVSIRNNLMAVFWKIKKKNRRFLEKDGLPKLNEEKIKTLVSPIYWKSWIRNSRFSGKEDQSYINPSWEQERGAGLKPTV